MKDYKFKSNFIEKKRDMKDFKFKSNFIEKKENIIDVSNKITSQIPLLLYQTWYTLDLPLDMKLCVEKLKKTNPEFTHYLYDDNMCYNFIKDNFDSNVLYAYEKIIPGAYKADLWRYCVLYKTGGIYLDIKFECINEFKLIKLTDKEYFVKDRILYNITGIYQGLLICYPNNPILLECINKIVKYVTNNIYTETSLSFSGPQLISKFFYIKDINNFSLHFSGKNIEYNNRRILYEYNRYRNEITLFDKKHYNEYYFKRNIFNYKLLTYKKRINISKEINKSIYINNINSNDIFFSSTPFIIRENNKYFMIMKYINYNYNEEGRKDINKEMSKWLSTSSYYFINNDFDNISENETFFKRSGMEDIRIYNYKNYYYYSLCVFNSKINKSSNSCIKSNDILKIEDNFNYTYTDFVFEHIHEKNWVYFEFENKLRIIYKWFPLTICNIDYNKNILSAYKYIYNVPEIFKSTRGSTCGVKYNNEIWFIVHTKQHYIYDKNIYFNYQHYFAVFDESMNLLRYSECFKFDNKKVEFCTCLIIEEDRVIIPHSTLDTNSYIGIYDIDTINNELKWFDEW